MMAVWLAYTALLTTVLSVAAAVVERVAPELARHRRWVWVGALAVSGALPIWSAARSLTTPPGTPAASRFPASPEARGLTTGIEDRLATLIAQADVGVLERLDTPLALAWIAAVVFTLAAYAMATWALASRRRSWRAVSVDGEDVLLSDTVGPAVIGAVRPRIVVPVWTLDLPAARQRLMLAHEREHIRARDPMLLHASALLVFLMPWNVAAWWLLRRLRLAVEMDCDARVLAAGGDMGGYGELLLDVCARRMRRGPFLAPALLERTSSLTRRILAMRATRQRVSAGRVTAAIGTAMVAGAVACVMPSPDVLTPRAGFELARQPVGAVRVAASPTLDDRAIVRRRFPLVASGAAGPSVLFVVEAADGTVVFTEQNPAGGVPRGASPTAPPSFRASASVAALRPEEIASVDVRKHAAGTVAPSAVSLVRIRLKPAAANRPPATGTDQ